MDTKIVVEDVHVDQNTGHITVTVKTVTSDGCSTWNGPIKAYGCDASMFHGRFQGDLEEVKKWIAGEHRAMIGVHPALVGDLMKLKGQVIS